MKRSNDMKTCFKLSALASALALAMGPASAADVYLAAKPFTKELPLSGGTTEAVPMWGYVLDEDNSDGSGGVPDGIGDCFQAADTAACIASLPDPAVPGPRISVDAADVTLTIHLSNGLPEPTSIVVPGQVLPTSTGGGPTWNNDSTGARGADATKRVRSYGSEAAADGGTESYSWNLSRSGTFMYHSGTWPQKQVYMGLYGALTKDAVAADLATGISAEVYGGVPYDRDVILFYSDIDPAHNAAVANAVAGYTPIRYNAKWFLINGEPYVAGVTADIPAGNAVGGTGSNTLVRLLSAASETHVPTLQGLYMDIHAEDGIRYQWQNGDAFGGFAPREQYSAMLPPLKTKDAMVVAEAEGRYAIYDGNGYMTNPSDPNDFTQGDEVGGMLRFLSVAAPNQAPVAVDDTATTLEDTSVVIDLLANDSDPNPGDLLTIVAVTQGAIGSVAIDDPSCCALYTPNLNANGLDSFDYSITDGNGVTSTATALVDVTVTAVNDPPAITSTPVLAATTGQPYSYDVDAADVDLGDTPPDVLTFSLDASPTGMSIDAASGVIGWTPTVQQDGVQAVTVRVTDSGALADTQSFDVDVALVNVPPVITSTPVAVATVNALYSYDVDVTDADLGDTQTYVLDVAPAGMTIDGGTGVIGWTPTLFQFGANDVTLSVTDFHGAVATQSYQVSVAAAGAGTDGPVFFSTSSNGAVPGAAGPYNNADIYAYDGAAYQRVLAFVATMGLNANVDALDIVDADTFYLSFSNPTRTLSIGGSPQVVQDEDVVLYDAGTWSLHFDGSVCGLDSNTAGGQDQDIDAVSIEGGTMYFSTLGGGNANPVGGVTGPYDDADVYSWAEGAATCGRAVDASTVGLPGNADIDGLTVRGGTYYLSFNRNGGVSVPTLGVVQDEAVVSFDGTNWSLYFSGPGLAAPNANAKDVDALDLP